MEKLDDKTKKTILGYLIAGLIGAIIGGVLVFFGIKKLSSMVAPKSNPFSLWKKQLTVAPYMALHQLVKSRHEKRNAQKRA